MNEKFSFYNRAVGDSPEAQNRFMSVEAMDFKHSFIDEEHPFKKYLFRERIKTEGEITEIARINDAVAKLVQSYGAAQLTVHAKDIHIVPEEQWEEKMPEYSGSYFPGIFMKSLGSMVAQSHVIAHAMIHLQSFNSATLYKKEKIYRKRRGGLSITERKTKKELLDNLDEALTEELAIRIFHILSTTKYFSKETNNFEKNKKENPKIPFSTETIAARLVPCGDDESKKCVQIFNFAYKDERAGFSELLKKVQIKNPDVFPSTQDIFDVFARAKFTGKLLELSKLLDATFGKGAFYKLAQADKKGTAALIQYIKSLR